MRGKLNRLCCKTGPLIVQASSRSAGMLLISEWWASEVMTILAGLLPDAERQLSAIAIYTTTNAMCFMLSLGISSAVATRYAVLEVRIEP